MNEPHEFKAFATRCSGQACAECYAPLDHPVHVAGNLRERAKWLESRSFASLSGDAERLAANVVDRLYRALLEIATSQIPPADSEAEYVHQRATYHLRSVAREALGIEDA